MKSKKIRYTSTPSGKTPATGPEDDLYLPVCCGEFGVQQAAGLRELWEATWSQDRRGDIEKTGNASPAPPAQPETEGRIHQTKKGRNET